MQNKKMKGGIEMNIQQLMELYKSETGSTEVNVHDFEFWCWEKEMMEQI